MPVEINRFDSNNLGASRRYLLATLSSERINDPEDQSMEKYMKFANLLEAHILASEGDKAVTRLWKDIYKAVERSEKEFDYTIYKGHLLVKIAVASLVSSGDLTEFVRLLGKSYSEDKLYGYTHPEYRPAYKILTFVQPILMFRDDLWPSEKKLRHDVAVRLSMVLFFNKSATAIAWRPKTLQNHVGSCIPTNNKLRKILIENTAELEEISMLANKKNTFYKSTTFLIANIVEGILMDLANRSLNSKPKREKSWFPFFTRKKTKKPDFERDSIRTLAKKLRREGVIDKKTEYFCRFIQHYRDFIHPARNLKHIYRPNVNFNKMFLFFFILLLEDLSNISSQLQKSD